VRLDDPDVVRREYANERGLSARAAVYRGVAGPDARDLALEAVRWMLYHVPDLDRGVAELARVLRPAGRLVAATNGLRHLGELWSLVGRDRASEPPRFLAETGGDVLERHFARVERRDLGSPITFAAVEAVRCYIASSVAHKQLAERVPHFDGPLRATRVAAIFVADKAAA